MGTIGARDVQAASGGIGAVPIVAVMAADSDLAPYHKLLHSLDLPSGIAFALMAPAMKSPEAVVLELEPETRVPVMVMAEGMPVRPDHIYVYDPARPFQVDAGRFTRRDSAIALSRGEIADLLRDTAELANAAPTLEMALDTVGERIATCLGWQACGPRAFDNGEGSCGEAGVVHLELDFDPGFVDRIRISLPVYCEGRVLGAIALRAPADRAPDASLHPVFARIGRQLEQVAARARFNERLLQEHAERARVGRIASMGEVANSLAHELSQPLCAVMNYAGALRRLVAQPVHDEEQMLRISECLSQQVMRAGDVLQSLKHFAVRHSAERERVWLPELLRYVPSLVRYRLDSAGVRLEWEVDDALPEVVTNWAYLEQILLNLLSNAIEALALRPHGERLLKLYAQADDNGVQIVVADSGDGVPPELRARIFDAFYTTRPGGIGMGLAVSRSLAETLGGKLWVESNTEGGASFLLSLPNRSRPSAGRTA